MKQLHLYDTTLRDGTQGEDVSFSVDDKLQIARMLDELGIHYIEGGWPGSNPKDLEFFRRAAGLEFNHAKIAAFGSTRRPDKRAKDDPNLAALLESETPVVTIFGKTWLLHVRNALQISDELNLEMIAESVAYLKANRREVIYDAEHFFDGYKHDREYALRTIRAAEEGGADALVLCDTNGGTMPYEVDEIVAEISGEVRTPLGIHTHNDCDLAAANTIAAVRRGAVHIQGTFNGYGERCGNVNLCSVVPLLQLKLGYRCISELQMRTLTHASRAISECANLPPRKHLPFVGESAFAHKGGIHVSAVMKDPQTYEHIDPELVGNRRRVLVSDLSGKSNVKYKAEELGIRLDGSANDAGALVSDIKQREYHGYTYENADASLELLIRQSGEDWREFFDLAGFKVIIHKESKNNEPVSEAIIKVRVGETEEYAAAEGNGPVNALDNALRKALEKFYPELADMTLSDYKVRVIDEHDGTKAKVRVLITSRNGNLAWNTIGVSPNIIEASWEALADSIYYYLMKTKISADV
jgi:2-isopropylmalate synthase